MLHSMLYAARAKVHNGYRAGFTLIELLVVIVLLGILMAIAVPTFQNVQQRGQAASAQTELKTALDIASGEYAYQANGAYPDTATLKGTLQQSEDNILFSEGAMNSTALNIVEDAIVADGSADALDGVSVGTPASGTVSVQVFNFVGGTGGASATCSGATCNALVLARQDVSRNTVIWWVVSNKKETLAQDQKGDFFGSTKTDYVWRTNDA